MIDIYKPENYRKIVKYQNKPENKHHWSTCRRSFVDCYRCQVIYGNYENIHKIKKEVFGQ